VTTYREFQIELERLHQQAERVRLSEKAAALDRIRALIVEYRLLPSDLGFSADRKSAPAPAKYRDPATGATWSGRGRTPNWLAGKDRSAYTIT